MGSTTMMSYTENWGNMTNTTVSPYQEILDYHFSGVYVHPHYYQYLDYIINLPDIYFYLMGIYIGIVGIIGTLGNLLVIYIFSTTRTLRTPPNIFIINLAISDMSFCLVNGFPLMTISAFARYWYFGKMGCTIYAMIGGLTGFNSIGTLACISMDRYYVIAYPFDAMRKCTKKRALIQVAFIWLWSGLLSFPPLFGFGSYIAEGVMVECSFNYVSQDWLHYIYNYLMLVVGFFLPVFAIILCYIFIIRAVSSQAQAMRAKAEKMGAEGAKTQKERQQNIQLAKIAAITISLFMLSWTPYAIFSAAGNNGYLSWVTPTTTQVPVLFAKTSAVWNPILYALSHPKFRGVLEEKFPFLLCCKGSNIDKGDDKSEVTETTKGNLGRDSSIMSDMDGTEMTGRTQVNSAPSGGNRRQESNLNSNYDNHSQGGGNRPSDVNPMAMTRAANTIFSHLVTAYEGMRVLTTSGDGSGANKLDNTFTNPAFEADRGSQQQMNAPMGYYGYGQPMPPPPTQLPQQQMAAGFVPIQGASRPSSPTPNQVYAVPVAPPGMVPYPGYFPAQPTLGQGHPAVAPQTTEANQQSVHVNPQVLVHPPQVQLNRPQVHLHPSLQNQPPPVPKADNQITTEATINNPSRVEQDLPLENNTTPNPDPPITCDPQISDVTSEGHQKFGTEHVSETCDDLPPPPEEFLDETEDFEDTAEYNFVPQSDIGAETAVHQTAAEQDSPTNSETDHAGIVEEVTAPGDESGKDGTTKQQHTEELEAIEGLNQAIDATEAKPSNEASPDVVSGDENMVCTPNDGNADGVEQSQSDEKQADEGNPPELNKQDSVSYEDGFV